MFKGIKVVKGDQVYSGLTIHNLVQMIKGHNPLTSQPLDILHIPDEIIPETEYKDAA